MPDMEVAVAVAVAVAVEGVMEVEEGTTTMMGPVGGEVMEVDVGVGVVEDIRLPFL